MKIISWNVNGLKSVMEKGFLDTINKLNADFICLQETKTNKEIKDFEIEGYYSYFNYSIKSGYSGVAIITKKEPDDILIGMELENEDGELCNVDNESRVITLEYNSFYIVSVYVPSSQRSKNRFNYRIFFSEKFNEYIKKLNSKKNVIICGDFNICYKKIDVCDFQKHLEINSFIDEEKADFEELLKMEFIDTYRFMHPQMRKYSFWTNETNREEKRTGWRLDYILISEYLKKNIREANILDDIYGSDHCPVELVISI